MAINPKTGLEEVTPTGVNINGVSDAQTPVGAQSLSGQNQGGLTDLQAGGIQAIYKANLAKGMSPLQAKEAIQANPAFEKAKAQYNAPAPAPEPTAPTPPAPETPTQTTSTPTTTPTKSEPVLINGKTQAEWDTSKGRENEITTNLSTITQQNPSLLQDRNAFDSAFTYTTADSGKKAILDSFYKTAQTQIANQKILSQYASYTPEQFGVAIINGTIVPGSSEYNVLTSDPATKVKIDKANALNTISGKSGVNANNVSDTTIKDVVSSSPTISGALSDGFFSSDEIKKLLSTPEIEKGKAELETLGNEYTTLKNTYDNIENDINKQYKNSFLTSTERARAIANAQKDILPSLQLKQDLYNNKLGIVSQLIKDSKDVFETNLSLYKEQKAAALAQANKLEERAYQEQQKRLEEAWHNPKLDSKDEGIRNLAINNSVNDMYKMYANLGVIGSRTPAQLQEYVKSEVKKGRTAGDVLSEINRDFQNREDYKAVIAKKTDSGKFSLGFDPITGSPYVLDTLTGTVTSGTGGITGTSGFKPSTQEMRTDRNNNPAAFTVDIAKQAGLIEGVDYVIGDKFPGNSNLYTAKLLGDPFEKTIKVIDSIGFKTKSGQNRWTYTDKLGLNNETWNKMSYSEKVSAIAKMYQQEGGNGSLIGIDQTQQSPTTTEQFTPSKKLAFDSYTEAAKKGTVAFKDVASIAAANGFPNVQSFISEYNTYKNTPVTSEGLTKDGFNPIKITDYTAYNSNKLPIATIKELQSSGQYEQFQKEAKAYGDSKKIEAVPTVNSFINDLEQLKKYGKSIRVSSTAPFVGGISQTLSGDAAKFASIYNQIIDKSALTELVKLKSEGATFGALSDKELTKIGSSSEAGQLTPYLSDEDWKSKIDDLIKSAKNIKTDITTVQSIPTQGGRVITTTGGRIKQ